MSGILSEREIDELLLSIYADPGCESGHPLPSFYPRLALMLRDLVESAPGSEAVVDKLERAEPPAASGLSFPDRNLVRIDFGTEGPSFLVALGGTDEETAAVLRARLAGTLGAALPEALKPKAEGGEPRLSSPLAEADFLGEAWAPGAAFALAVNGKPLLVSLFPSKAASEGLADPPESPPERRVALYDFMRSELFSRTVLAEIFDAQRRFALRARRALSEPTRSCVCFSVASVDQLTFEEFRRCLPSPTLMAILSMKPLEGRAILELSPELASELLDLALGGPGSLQGRGRELTAAELAVIGALLPGLAQALAGAWAPIARLEPRIEGFESEPALADIAPAGEMVVLAELEASIDNRAAGTLGFCLPYGLLAPLLGPLSGRGPGAGARRAEAPLVGAEALDALPLARYASFAPRAPGLSARALGAALGEARAGGGRIEVEPAGRFGYEAAESR